MLVVCIAIFIIFSNIIVAESTGIPVNYRTLYALRHLNEFRGLRMGYFMPFVFYISMEKPDIPMPWYLRFNVCPTVEVVPENEELREWTQHGFQGSPAYMGISDENCKGNDEKFVCMKRIKAPDGNLYLIVTEYKCCPGFTHHPNISGCVRGS